jgi:radical SAM superfamily enzyme YgiQ (UPF0313 family)
MVERRLDKRFAIMASLEAGLNGELLQWLQRAGCFLACVGLEAIEEDTLRCVRKAANLKVGIEHYGQAIAGFHAHGMAVLASLIFGHDTDSPETYRQLERFVTEEGIDSPVYTILTPLPGTDLWERLEAEGRLGGWRLPQDYACFDMHHALFEPRGVTAQEMLAAKEAAVRRSTSVPALLAGLWRTWRRTGSPLAAWAACQNSLWARVNMRS